MAENEAQEILTSIISDFIDNNGKNKVADVKKEQDRIAKLSQITEMPAERVKHIITRFQNELLGILPKYFRLEAQRRSPVDSLGKAFIEKEFQVSLMKAMNLRRKLFKSFKVEPPAMLGRDYFRRVGVVALDAKRKYREFVERRPPRRRPGK